MLGRARIRTHVCKRVTCDPPLSHIQSMVPGVKLKDAYPTERESEREREREAHTAREGEREGGREGGREGEGELQTPSVVFFDELVNAV